MLLLSVLFMSAVFADLELYGPSDSKTCTGCRKEMSEGKYRACNDYFQDSTKTDCDWAGLETHCQFTPVTAATVAQCAVLCEREYGCNFYTHYSDQCTLHLMTVCTAESIIPQQATTVYQQKLSVYNVHLDPTTELGECQGDCDSDSQCAGDLVCFQRDSAGTIAQPPSCVGYATENWNYCVQPYNPYIHNIAVNPAQNLIECQGDCDTDSDCVGSLRCFERSGDGPSAPGCTGTHKTNWDYCYNPYNEVATDIHMNPTYKLIECQGDCDSDSDCLGGLLCYQRDADQAPPPGCAGVFTYNWDYCYNPANTLVNVAVNGVTDLLECQGDCDNDSECVGDLKCFQRGFGVVNPPGCPGRLYDQWDYCYNPWNEIINNVAVDPTELLIECEGDCDNDAQCVGDLVCYHRTGGGPPPPGCAGTMSGLDWDYCYNPSNTLVNVAVDPTTQLSECQGDCDNDSQCVGDLKCLQRGFENVNPPGCPGRLYDQWDYCYNPYNEIITHVALDPTELLIECEGDCDNDAQCVGDLLCYHRTGTDGGPPPPGCYSSTNIGAGSVYHDWDYCYNPDNTLVNVAVDGVTDLLECQGDCDDDSQCAGDLKCYQRGFGTVNPPHCPGRMYDQWDYCYNPYNDVLTDVNVNPTQLLIECEGDCDDDNDCVGTLKCFHRTGDVGNAPGCTGTHQTNWDYCYNPYNVFITNVDLHGEYLIECQGDCDNDSDCVGDLECYERDGDAPNPPGCIGQAQTNWDYCYNPIGGRRRRLLNFV